MSYVEMLVMYLIQENCW